MATTAVWGFEQPLVYCELPVAQAPVEPLAGGLLPADYGDGSRLILLQPDGSTLDLAPGFSAACEPDVAFDGGRVLFAGKRNPGDVWNIFEVATDGTGLHQITHESLDARHPVYLSTFYTIVSPEPWYTILFVRDDGVLNETSEAPATSLYTVKLDGSELRRITFHPGNDRTPYLLQDGLLLFAGLRNGNRMQILGIQTDGIDYSSYGARAGMRLQHMPTLTSDGRVVFVESDSFGWDGAGSLGSVRTRRPHHTYEALTGAPDGLFHSPSPLANGSLLVSLRRGADPFGIVRFTPRTGDIETIHQSPGNHILHARVATPRPEPDGRSSTVRTESEIGKLYCLDVYESDPAFAALEPGSAASLRVIEGLPLEDLRQSTDDTPPVAAGGRVHARILGEAPVEDDGSFHVDLPANMTVRLQVLDADGMALASCDWLWVREREYRGCIGCHEDPELTPPNRFVKAARRPATLLNPPVAERRSVTFVEQIVPLLSGKCRSCHQESGKASASGLQLASLDDKGALADLYSSLLEPDSGLVTPGAARTSPLVWRLLGRNTSRPWDGTTSATQEIPSDHADLLAPEERSLIVEWIDLGAQWDAHRSIGAER